MKPNPDMLRLARLLRGFNQTEAAKRLGVDQPVFSRIENSAAEFREELVARAVSAFELPQSFFFQTDPVYGAPVSVHPMWRKKAEVSAREMDIVIAELNVRVMHLRRLLQGADVAYSSDLPRFDIEDYGDPKKIAELVRAHWKIPRGPLLDLTRCVEKAGIIVIHSPMGGASISGVTFAVPGIQPIVVLNSEQPADRMRFTLAHELGHLVMHRFPTPLMEEEANAFASALLLPAVDLKPYFLGRTVDLALLAALKPEWRVSMQSLLMAASELLPLTTNQKQYLWKQMSMRGYRLREPPELDFEREYPSVLPNILHIHRKELGYSLEELAKILHVYESELSSYYQLDANKQKRPIFFAVK